MNNKRQDWDSYFLSIASLVATRSTCLRAQHGAVIVKNNIILATGYNGAPRNLRHCCDEGSCYRKDNNISPGTKYELCKSVHAEQNAIASAARSGQALEGATLYITDLPCGICAKLLINAGIKKIVYIQTERYADRAGMETLIEGKIELKAVKEDVL